MTFADAPTAKNPKRAAILRHAIAVFAREGFRHTDVQVIADQAGVGKGTVYRNFPSKEELFDAATYDVLERLEHCLFSSIDGVEDPLHAMYTLGMAHMGFFERNPEYLEIFVQNRAEFRGTIPPDHKALHERMIGQLGEVVQQGIQQGRIKPSDPRQIVVSMGTVLYGAIMFGCYVADDFSLRQLGEVALRSFLDGVRLETPGENQQGSSR